MDFQLKIVETDFSTHNVAWATPPKLQKDSFFPERLVKLGKVGWIRENRVLPVQLNPVQYNPARREIRLYHKLVVEVHFSSGRAPRQSTALSTLSGGSHAESIAYNTLFDDMLVNPQSAARWRTPILRSPAAPKVFTGYRPAV